MRNTALRLLQKINKSRLHPYTLDTMQWEDEGGKSKKYCNLIGSKNQSANNLMHPYINVYQFIGIAFVRSFSVASRTQRDFALFL